MGSQGIFHPHIHALVEDGVFSESGAFCVLPATPSQLLVQQLRHAVLNYLVEEGQQVHVNVDEQLTPMFANEYWPAVRNILPDLLIPLIQWMAVVAPRDIHIADKNLKSRDWINHPAQVQLVFKSAPKHDSDQGISRFFPEAQNIDYYRDVDIEIIGQNIKLKIRVER